MFSDVLIAMNRKISLILILTMMVCVITGCNSEKNVVMTENAVAEAELAVAGFLDDVISYNLGEYEDYFLGGSDTENIFGTLTDIERVSAELENILTRYDVSVDDETLESWTGKALGKFYGNVDYVITSETADNDKAAITVSVEIPDVTVIVDVKRSDIETLFCDTFGFDVGETDTLYSELANRRGTTADVVKSEYAGSDKGQLVNDVCIYFADELNNLYDLVLNDVFENPKTDTVLCEFTVEKTSDGQWKIAGIDSESD